MVSSWRWIFRWPAADFETRGARCALLGQTKGDITEQIYHRVEPIAKLCLSSAPMVKIRSPRLLYIQTVFFGGTVIIEDDHFVLGMPTPVQMLRKHARLVEAECEQLRHELDRARRTSRSGWPSIRPRPPKSPGSSQDQRMT
ncbi:protein of unknown function [Pseudomonas sp. JV241A]|nr:protein of unknown function [Pseudomonas sp. JV241A]